MNNSLPKLAPKVELETKYVLKQLSRSHKALAELNGDSRSFFGMIIRENL